MHQVFVRGYSSKVKKFINLTIEYKALFGNLVETSSQKKIRLKSKKKGKIPKEIPNGINTELFWVQKNFGNKLKKVIVFGHPQNKSLTHDKSQKIPLKQFSESLTDQNIQNFHSESNQDDQKIELKNTNSTCNLSTVTKNIDNSHVIPTIKSSSFILNTKNSYKNVSLPNLNGSDMENAIAKRDIPFNSVRLPDIVINHLLSFPIMGTKKEISAQSTEIFSISKMDDPETIRFPSVSKILTQTMLPESKLALEAWKVRMIEKLGLEGFEMHQKALLRDGSAFHSCIAQSLLGKEFEVPSEIKPVFESVQHVLNDVDHVKAIESYVAHPKLHYKGIIDCVASYRGENYLIDWKKSERKKLNLKEAYDAPKQIAAYIGAINASNIYPFVIKRGLLVIAYTCGASATVHEMCDNTLQQYWTEWLRRLQTYYVETRSNDDNKSIRQ